MFLTGSHPIGSGPVASEPVANTDTRLTELLHDTADAVARALGDQPEWGLAGTRPGQHHSDLRADQAALEVLDAAGVGVLSEESGLRREESEVMVVVDPLDGSTNASRGVPWYATSLCAIDSDGPAAALVVDLVHDVRYEATRGDGAVCRQGRTGTAEALIPADVSRLDEALVGISGFPERTLGWRQYRALGAAALDICCVASGTLDGYVDCSANAHGVWDYLAATLICREAGAAVADAEGRELLTLIPSGRRTPVAAANPELLGALMAQRRSLG